MKAQIIERSAIHNSNAWLKSYYLTRFAFSAVWVALAFTVGKSSAGIAAVMLILYPTWDALANWLDAKKNGGLRSNVSQTFNLVVSVLAAASIAYSLTIGMKQVLFVFGAWALLAGIAQLATGIRRWKTYGAQCVMILSGGQSALVSVHFFQKATAVPVPGIEAVAPYAALGAFYFLLSGIWLLVSDARRRSKAAVVSMS
jgi:uncharacterized membrane protein HdeD (DUF308 family)